MTAALTIENRFIMEKLTNWEHQLEIKAMQLIKGESSFTHYEELAKKKEAIINELKYLLPTLSELCPIELDINNIDCLIERISKSPAA